MRSLHPANIIFVMVFSACTLSEKKAKERIIVLDNAFVSSSTIYFLGEENIPLSSVVSLPLQGFKSIEVFPDSITFDGYQAKLIEKGDDEFINDITLLINTFTHLSEDETTKLGDAEHAISLTFFGTSENVIHKQKVINDYIFTLVQGRQVIVVDESTFQFYNPAQWKEYRVDNFTDEIKNVAGQIIIHTYRENEYCRAVTLGMNKFCLPEISIKDFACSNQNSIGNLINATAQTLFEDPFIFQDSTLTIVLNNIKNEVVRDYLLTGIVQDAKQMVNIKLRSVSPEEGDNPTTQFIIACESADYASPQEEQNVLITTLFGSADSLAYAQHDEELLKASENARKRLPELKQLFNKGLDPGYSIMVKAPFETDDGNNEWMWVEVTKWTDREMEGILQNDPYEVSGLKAGASVAVDEGDVFDYLIVKPDGSYEGNETGEILEERN
jgi:uncharacterized protein YegJ (DUF2314 family)